MEKSDLRKIYLEKRASLSSGEVAKASGEIAERFFRSVVLPPGGIVHTFIRIGRFNEIDTSMIYYRLWRDRPDIAMAAPRTDLETGDIESVAFDSSSDWNENRYCASTAPAIASAMVRVCTIDFSLRAGPTV
jgi:5-formyltetrahydrofolate cyclo-ligase